MSPKQSSTHAYTRNAVIAILALLLAAAPALAREGAIHPIKAPASLIHARAACPVNKPLECRAALVHAYDALRWQRHARQRHQATYGVKHALRLASALYDVPLGQLRRVGTCESHLHPLSKNTSSTASGLFQFLDTTWRRAGIPGFSVFDPYANAIAAARLVQHDGGWHEWSCQP